MVLSKFFGPICLEIEVIGRKPATELKMELLDGPVTAEH